MEGKTAHLNLAIDPGSEPISGSLSGPNQEPQRFNGWIELVAEIERVRSNGSARQENEQAA